MYGVTINNYELFSLRTLLKCQRGCQTFSDILTVDGFMYPTFREACGAYGFAHDDSEFIACFNEFSETTIASVSSLRHQFAFMLCAIKTLNPIAVFEHFDDDLCGSDSRETTLRCIENKMQVLGRSLCDADFSFTDVQRSDEIDDIDADDDSIMLSEEQRQALDKLLFVSQLNASAAKVSDDFSTGRNWEDFFVHKAARAMKLAGLKTMCVAASCLASPLLPNGKTAHQALKIPSNCDDNSYCNWSQELRRKLKKVSVIFWDEVSMVSSTIAETVERSFR